MSEDLAITRIEQDARAKLLDVLKRHENSIKVLVGDSLNPSRFATLAVTAIRQNPRLLNCSPASFLNSVLLATQMKLEIRRDSCYLVPFGKECQLLIDYKAKLALARRSGKVGGIQAVTIRKRDQFECYYDERGFHLRHRASPNGEILSPEERGPMVGFYGFAEIADAGMQWREPMSLAEVDRIRRRSRAGVKDLSVDDIFAAEALTDDGKQQVWQTWDYKDPRRQPWVTDFEQMALKTVLHSLYKSIPLDSAAQLSQEVDEGYDTGKQPKIIEDFASFDIIDNQPILPEGSKEAQEKVVDQKLEGMGKSPKDIPPRAAIISEIKGFKKKLGDKWIEVLGATGYETVEQIPTEEAARVVRQAMRDLEIALSPGQS
jgi:recombination protein RecT